MDASYHHPTAPEVPPSDGGGAPFIDSRPGQYMKDVSTELGSPVWLITNREDFSAMAELLSSETLISIDTETWGNEALGERPDKHLRLIQITIPKRGTNGEALEEPGDTYIVDVEALEAGLNLKGRKHVLDPLKTVLENPDQIKIAYHAQFEIAQFKKYGITCAGMADPMKTASEQRPDLLTRTLQAVLKEQMDIEISKEVRDEGFHGPLKPHQFLYAARDSCVTLLLYFWQSHIEERFQAAISEISGLTAQDLFVRHLLAQTEARRLMSELYRRDDYLITRIRAKEAYDALRTKSLEKWSAQVAAHRAGTFHPEPDEDGDRLKESTDGVGYRSVSHTYEMPLDPIVVKTLFPKDYTNFVDEHIPVRKVLDYLAGIGWNGEAQEKLLTDTLEPERIENYKLTLTLNDENDLAGVENDPTEQPPVLPEEIVTTDAELVALVETFKSAPFLSVHFVTKTSDNEHPHWIYIGVIDPECPDRVVALDIAAIDEDRKSSSGYTSGLLSLQAEVLSNPQIKKYTRGTLETESLRFACDGDQSADIARIVTNILPELKHGPKALGSICQTLLGYVPPEPQMLLEVALRLWKLGNMGRMDPEYTADVLHRIYRNETMHAFMMESGVAKSRAEQVRLAEAYRTALKEGLKPEIDPRHPSKIVDLTRGSATIAGNPVLGHISWASLTERYPNVAEQLHDVVERSVNRRELELFVKAKNPELSGGDLENLFAGMVTTRRGEKPVVSISNNYSIFYSGDSSGA